MSIKGKPQHGHTRRRIRRYSGRVWAGVRKQSANNVWQGEARCRRPHNQVDRDGRPLWTGEDDK